MHRTRWIMVLTLLVGPGLLARAADKADPTGNWEWTVETGDQKMEFQATFKLEKDKLTGEVTRKPEGKGVKIENAKLKDGEISFQYTREVEGRKITPKYSGKIAGDEIKGKITVDFDGQEFTLDWHAKRVKDKK